MKNKLLVGRILCGWEKAFDCVNPDFFYRNWNFMALVKRLFKYISFFKVKDIVEQQYIMAMRIEMKFQFGLN